MLHDDWLMRRLRPKGVSSGSMDRQSEATPQSPQPSQTMGLMNVRTAGSGDSPRLRRRRRSVAQGCTYVDLDGPLLQQLDRATPLTYRNGVIDPPVAALWG